ncbi:MAG: Holliday junction branch migration protein RuvA, partial [Clostridia bacterium]
MIAYLIGKLTFKGENKIFVEVKGVGYELLVSAFTLNNLPALLEEIKILTYMQVKDDGIVLIGFFTEEEKAMFTNLLQVSSVGPKLALAVLSGLSPALLACAIAKEDVKTISSIKGVGKKTSERIVLELKDKIDKSFAIGEFTHENN